MKNVYCILTSLVNVSIIVTACTHTKCVSLTNQNFEIQPTVINLNPNEYSQELHYYPFEVKLDRCLGSNNTLNDLSNKVCVPNKTNDLNIHVFNKTNDLNIHVFNMITGINESEILIKHISCECKCKFDGKKRNSYQKWNNDKCQYERKNLKKVICAKKIIFAILLNAVVKMVNI